MIIEKKVLIFDMDETLIHCVDDIETEDPDVIIPIDFPDEEEIVNVRSPISVSICLGRDKRAAVRV
jgi:FMN phosphatase YigB (HAD superfamily)